MKNDKKWSKLKKINSISTGNLKAGELGEETFNKLITTFISIIEEENEFTAIRKYIQTEPSVTKSKYVTKFLNKFNGFNE